MADETDAQGKVIDAMIETLKASTTPEILQAQQILARRLALSGGVIPSRIPAPKNITEIGGYFNLLETLEQPDLRAQVLASILGVSGPNPPLGWPAPAPELWFAKRLNDRPAGAVQPMIPVDVLVRSDFASAFGNAIDAIHAAGGMLPLMWASRPLPTLASAPTELLAYVGRQMRMVPLAALNDPTSDPLAVGNPNGGAGNRVFMHALWPATQPILSGNFELWECDGVQCTKQPYAGTDALPMLDLEPVLGTAGWYHSGAIADPVSLSSPGDWSTWSNVTGLAAGDIYGNELRRLYTAEQIASSSVRDSLDWKWDGAQFAP